MSTADVDMCAMIGVKKVPVIHCRWQRSVTHSDRQIAGGRGQMGGYYMDGLQPAKDLHTSHCGMRLNYLDGMDVSSNVMEAFRRQITESKEGTICVCLGFLLLYR